MVRKLESNTNSQQPKANRRDFVVTAGAGLIGAALCAPNINVYGATSVFGFRSFFRKIARFAEMVGMVALGVSPRTYIGGLKSQVATDINNNLQKLMQQGYSFPEQIYGNSAYPVIFAPMIGPDGSYRGLVPVYNLGQAASSASRLYLPQDQETGRRGLFIKATFRTSPLPSIIGLATLEDYAKTAPRISGQSPAEHAMALEDVGDDLHSKMSYKSTDMFKYLMPAGGEQFKPTSAGYIYAHRSLGGAIRSEYKAITQSTGDLQVQVLRKREGVTGYVVDLDNTYRITKS
jgi:hypothetical protein